MSSRLLSYNVIFDTKPLTNLVSLNKNRRVLDDDQEYYRDVYDWFLRNLARKEVYLIISEAVLVESVFFLKKYGLNVDGINGLVGEVISTGVYPIRFYREVNECVLDFADASLLYIADKIVGKPNLIITSDERLREIAVKRYNLQALTIPLLRYYIG